MEMDEFISVAQVMESLFPSMHILDNEIVTKFWYGQLGKIPAGDALEFLAEWSINNSRYAPSIGDFLRDFSKKHSPNIKDAMEAWGDVQRAVSKYGYMRELEALDSLDDLTRSIVKDIGFKEFCMTDESNLPVLRAQFRNAYEARAKRKEEEQTRLMLGADNLNRIEGGVMDGD